jgi:hypothetical protein
LTPHLTLLLPARGRFRGQPLPKDLGKLLARADRSEAHAGNKSQLQRHFDMVPAHWAVAAITRHLDADGAEQQAWLRADPAWVQADINGGRMLACGELGLTMEEAEAFVASLKTLFGDEGFPILAPTPSRWYLMLPRESKYPVFDPPEDVLGDDLEPHLPPGDIGRRWRRLLNEAQVLLHNHPLNERRIAQGKPPVNSLWFWGGGVLPDFVRTPYASVHGEEVVLRGLCKLAKHSPKPMPNDYAKLVKGGDVLVDLRDATDLADLAQRCILPAAGSLRRRDVLQLDFGDGALFAIRRSQRWRFWRRAWTSLA